MNEVLMYETFREGYGIDQIRETMTVGELISFLEQFDEDKPVYLSFDNGGSPWYSMGCDRASFRSPLVRTKSSQRLSLKRSMSMCFSMAS